MSSNWPVRVNTACEPAAEVPMTLHATVNWSQEQLDALARFLLACAQRHTRGMQVVGQEERAA
jgi:hypothetical protein